MSVKHPEDDWQYDLSNFSDDPPEKIVIGAKKDGVELFELYLIRDKQDWDEDDAWEEYRQSCFKTGNKPLRRNQVIIDTRDMSDFDIWVCYQEGGLLQDE